MNELEDAGKYGLRALAHAITPTNSIPTVDAAGVSVTSLTEAVMGMTAAMVQIADAIGELAQSVRDHVE